MEQFGYITFKSVSYAIKFESKFKNYDVKIKIIPVPRSISSSCGMCIRFNLKDLKNIKDIIIKENLEYHNLYTNL